MHCQLAGYHFVIIACCVSQLSSMDITEAVQCGNEAQVQETCVSTYIPLAGGLVFCAQVEKHKTSCRGK